MMEMMLGMIQGAIFDWIAGLFAKLLAAFVGGV